MRVTILCFPRILLFLCGALSAATGGFAQSGTFSHSGFVEYLPGTLPVIISVPHDGDKAPVYIPDRTCEGAQTKADIYTREMGYRIYDSFEKLFGETPHLIVNHLKRKKADVNREVDAASCGNPTAAKVWVEYHNMIDSISRMVQFHFGKGLYIDLHAHGHKEQVLEIGYLLDAEELQLENADLNAEFFAEKSSVRHLARSLSRGMDFAGLLRGKKSLGAMFAAQGYPSIPSPSKPAPSLQQPFFKGGYSTARHGSSEGGTIDGIQIETNSSNVRDSHSSILRFSEAFAKVIGDYLEVYYQYSVPRVSKAAE